MQLMLNDGEREIIRKTLCIYKVILKDKSGEKFAEQACSTGLMNFYFNLLDCWFRQSIRYLMEMFKITILKWHFQ